MQLDESTDVSGWECLQDDLSVIKCTEHIVRVQWATVVHSLSVLEKIGFQQYMTSSIIIFIPHCFMGERNGKQSVCSYRWSSWFYWNKMSHGLRPPWNVSIGSSVDKEIHQIEARSVFDIVYKKSERIFITYSEEKGHDHGYYSSVTEERWLSHGKMFQRLIAFKDRLKHIFSYAER